MFKAQYVLQRTNRAEGGTWSDLMYFSDRGEAQREMASRTVYPSERIAFRIVYRIISEEIIT